MIRCYYLAISLCLFACRKTESNELHINAQLLGKKWVPVEEQYVGWFKLYDDGTVLGNDGCNSCQYARNSVYFLVDGTIHWVARMGAACTLKACPPSDDGNTEIEKKSAYLSSNSNSYSFENEKLTIPHPEYGPITYKTE